MATEGDAELFGNYPEEWLAGQRMRLMPATWNKYHTVTRRYLRPYFREMPLKDIGGVGETVSHPSSGGRGLGATDGDAELFGNYPEEWLAGQRMRLMPATWKSYQALSRRYLQPDFGEMALTDISTRLINQAYAALLDHGGRAGASLSPRTVNYCHLVLSRTLDGATLSGLIDRNPAWGAAVPRQRLKPSPHGAQTWTARELSDFLQAICGYPYEVLFRVAAATGMRRGELLALTWEEVDLRSRTLRVRWAISYDSEEIARSDPKNGKGRTISLDATTTHLLERQRLRSLTRPRDSTALGADWDLVFAGDHGGVLNPDVVSRWFRNFVHRAGLRRIRFQDLRHTHATILLAQGVPVHVVSARLGHSPQMTLSYYAHVIPPSDEAAAGSWSATVD